MESPPAALQKLMLMRSGVIIFIWREQKLENTNHSYSPVKHGMSHWAQTGRSTNTDLGYSGGKDARSISNTQLFMRAGTAGLDTDVQCCCPLNHETVCGAAI